MSGGINRSNNHINGGSRQALEQPRVTNNSLERNDGQRVEPQLGESHHRMGVRTAGHTAGWVGWVRRLLNDGQVGP